ncbi:hypothetical protein TSAR_005346 [Trichomalopsis sarcophagae]|uniref:Secreted protein n=1 Tax=Trichomalopsis sarcophagae TaxID=543379 RepID=A0A232FBS2_9HYME|nr:hypothetical protein TSAR_005346 [Trichomalopsis sarcophagae]
MLSLLLLSLRSLLVSASPDVDDDGVGIEDEVPKGGIPFPGGKMPSPDELLKMLDSMSGLSDEDKAALRADLLKQAQGGAGAFEEEASQHLATSFFTSQLFILLAMLTIISLIFGNFNGSGGIKGN